jgi:hypothetical protein
MLYTLWKKKQSPLQGKLCVSSEECKKVRKAFGRERDSTGDSAAGGLFVPEGMMEGFQVLVAQWSV